MTARAVAQLLQEGFAGEPVVERSISMRYWGQNYEQDVPLPHGPVTPTSLERTLAEFHRLHERFYGYSIAGEVIELIRFNVVASGEAEPVALPSLAVNGRPDAPARPPQTRPVFFAHGGFRETPIWRRDDLPAGFATEGPAIVEEVSATTVVHPGQRLTIDAAGVMTIER
jgi:N-methylhydantoinase A